jgi:hypothetical protein
MAWGPAGRVGVAGMRGLAGVPGGRRVSSGPLGDGWYTSVVKFIQPVPPVGCREQATGDHHSPSIYNYC